MKKRVSGIAAAAVGILAACGGKVVVDGSPSGTGGTLAATGGGSNLGTGGTTMLSGNGGGVSCFTLPHTLAQCSVTSGTPCVITYCEDPEGVTWSAECQATACQCLRNGEEICTCALSGAGDICAGTPDCCYHN
jgi:hypothetical protein